jgi:hypothetical protein
MERRPLTVGMNTIPNADPEQVRRFVKAEPPPDSAHQPQQQDRRPELTRDPQSTTSSKRRGRTKSTGVTPVGLIPVTVRLRPDVAGALKRASLERQLAGEVMFTQQDLVEEALEPWLRENGYLE